MNFMKCLDVLRRRYESTTPSNTVNRGCSTKVCSCSNGVGQTGTACSSHNAAECASCTGSYYLSGESCVAWTTCSDDQSTAART